MATTTMNISLPDSMRTFIEEQIADEGYGTASEYVRDLIRAEQKRREERKLEKLLLERLNSNERDIDMDEVRNALTERLRMKQK